MKIVIAPDSFKGSLTASEVATTITDALHSRMPECECLEIPLGDGGEGTLDAVASSFGGNIVECKVDGPLGEPVIAKYAVSSAGRVAFMEMAQAAGLTLVAGHLRNPMLTTTYGVGQMILDAVHRGVGKICMGLGGSATNDGGMGMLRALGYVFKDYAWRELEGNGSSLLRVASIDSILRNPAIDNVEFIAACDVTNPFFGPEGAARVFAPQKGADAAMTEALDRGLRNFANVVFYTYGIDLQIIPGSGAAGGVGGAFAAFLKAKMKTGIEMVLDMVDFDKKIEDADLIITGEGCLDRQSLMGKTVAGVFSHAEKFKVPVVAIGGCVKDNEILEKTPFNGIYEIKKPGQSLSEAMNPEIARRNIRNTIIEIFQANL